ncbi:hypothetical protein SSX86_031815 [Deinandra increscens subsp. villosa]|uniref:Uncharacterized protein n=1 Tax=Deinandra increscens subsp. villosa TaxID=3103831 RepID=A0AAP0C5V5_9ASTR
MASSSSNTTSGKVSKQELLSFVKEKVDEQMFVHDSLMCSIDRMNEGISIFLRIRDEVRRLPESDRRNQMLTYLEELLRMEHNTMKEASEAIETERGTDVHGQATPDVGPTEHVVTIPRTHQASSSTDNINSTSKKRKRATLRTCSPTLQETPSVELANPPQLEQTQTAITTGHVEGKRCRHKKTRKDHFYQTPNMVNYTNDQSCSVETVTEPGGDSMTPKELTALCKGMQSQISNLTQTVAAQGGLIKLLQQDVHGEAAKTTGEAAKTTGESESTHTPLLIQNDESVPRDVREFNIRSAGVEPFDVDQAWDEVPVVELMKIVPVVTVKDTLSASLMLGGMQHSDIDSIHKFIQYKKLPKYRKNLPTNVGSSKGKSVILGDVNEDGFLFSETEDVAHVVQDDPTEEKALENEAVENNDDSLLISDADKKEEAVSQIMANEAAEKPKETVLFSEVQYEDFGLHAEDKPEEGVVAKEPGVEVIKEFQVVGCQSETETVALQLEDKNAGADMVIENEAAEKPEETVLFSEPQDEDVGLQAEDKTAEGEPHISPGVTISYLSSDEFIWDGDMVDSQIGEVLLSYGGTSGDESNDELPENESSARELEPVVQPVILPVQTVVQPVILPIQPVVTTKKFHPAEPIVLSKYVTDLTELQIKSIRRMGTMEDKWVSVNIHRCLYIKTVRLGTMCSLVKTTIQRTIDAPTADTIEVVEEVRSEGTTSQCFSSKVYGFYPIGPTGCLINKDVKGKAPMLEYQVEDDWLNCRYPPRLSFVKEPGEFACCSRQIVCPIIDKYGENQEEESIVDRHWKEEFHKRNYAEMKLAQELYLLDSSSVQSVEDNMDESNKTTNIMVDDDKILARHLQVVEVKKEIEYIELRKQIEDDEILARKLQGDYADNKVMVNLIEEALKRLLDAKIASMDVAQRKRIDKMNAESKRFIQAQERKIRLNFSKENYSMLRDWKDGCVTRGWKTTHELKGMTEYELCEYIIEKMKEKCELELEKRTVDDVIEETRKRDEIKRVLDNSPLPPEAEHMALKEYFITVLNENPRRIRPSSITTLRNKYNELHGKQIEDSNDYDMHPSVRALPASSTATYVPAHTSSSLIDSLLSGTPPITTFKHPPAKRKQPIRKPKARTPPPKKIKPLPRKYRIDDFQPFLPGEPTSKPKPFTQPTLIKSNPQPDPEPERVIVDWSYDKEQKKYIFHTNQGQTLSYTLSEAPGKLSLSEMADVHLIGHRRNTLTMDENLLYFKLKILLDEARNNTEEDPMEISPRVSKIKYWVYVDDEKRVSMALVTCTVALGGAAVGIVAGTIKGPSTETGLVRGACVGVITGAITALQLMDMIIDGEPFSKVLHLFPVS